MLPKLGPLGFIRSLLRIVAGRPQVPASLADNRLLQTILKRRSVRRFRTDPLPDDAFAAILEAGRLAPCTVNMQTWSLATFTAATWQAFFGRGMPFRGQRAVIVLADTHRSRAVLDVFPDCPLIEHTVAVMNASLAAMNMNIAAEALGISSVMLSETGRSGFLDAAYLKEKLALPDGVIPIMTIVFGFARAAYGPMPPKLALGDISFEGAYRETDPAAMQAWLAQMMAGYQVSFPGSSFQGQIRTYTGKITSAEADLQRMVFRKA